MHTHTHTEERHDLIVLNDFQRTASDKTKLIDAFTLMKNEVSRSRVHGGEVDCQRTKTAITRQTESRMLVEDHPVQVDAKVSLHVFGAIVQHLIGAN